MKRILFLMVMGIIPFLLSGFVYADEISDRVDDLFMKASSGEVPFRDLVEPSKKELIAMGEKAVPQLITKLTTEDARERQTLEDLFKGIGEPAAPYLIEALKTDNLYQLRQAITCLGKTGSKLAAPELIRLFTYDNHTVRSAAVSAIGEIGDSSAVGDIINLLSDQAETVRKSAAVALGKIKSPVGIHPLIKAMDDPHFSVRYSASASLVQIGEKSGDVLLAEAPELTTLGQSYAIEVWSGLKYKPAWRVLSSFLKSDDSHLRGQTILALAAIKPKQAERLIDHLRKNETDGFVLSMCQKAAAAIAVSRNKHEH